MPVEMKRDRTELLKAVKLLERTENLQCGSGGKCFHLSMNFYPTLDLFCHKRLASEVECFNSTSRYAMLIQNLYDNNQKYQLKWAFSFSLSFFLQRKRLKINIGGHRWALEINFILPDPKSKYNSLEPMCKEQMLLLRIHGEQ